MSKFNVDSITPANWVPVHAIRRKVADLCAAQINLPDGFELRIDDKIVEGESGDYIIFNEDCTKSFCSKAEFKEKYELLRTNFVVESVTKLPKIPEPIIPTQIPTQAPNNGAPVGNVVSTGMRDLFKGTSWGNK